MPTAIHLMKYIYHQEAIVNKAPPPKKTFLLKILKYSNSQMLFLVKNKQTNEQTYN